MAGSRLSSAGSASEGQITGVYTERIFRHRVTKRVHRAAASAGMMRLPASNLLLYGGQRLGRSARDHFPLGLSDNCKNSDGQVVGIWNIRSQEPRTAVPESKQKGSVTRQTIKLGDDHRRIGQLGSDKRLPEHGSIIAAARLDFRELSQERHATTSCKLLHGMALGLQTQTTPTLGSRADAIVGDRFHCTLRIKALAAIERLPEWSGVNALPEQDNGKETGLRQKRTSEPGLKADIGTTRP